MFKSIAAILVLTAAIAAPAIAHADSLVGTTLGASLTGTPGLSVTNQFAPSAIVGPGTEFTGSFFDAFHQSYDVDVDVYASGFSLDVTSPFSKANISSIRSTNSHSRACPHSSTDFPLVATPAI